MSAFIPGARTLTRRIANYNVPRDPVSGWYIPTFTETQITGLLIERGGNLPPIAAGLVIIQDAAVFTTDEIKQFDHVKDGAKFYLVTDVKDRKDTDGDFIFNACQLSILDLTEGA